MYSEIAIRLAVGSVIPFKFAARSSGVSFPGVVMVGPFGATPGVPLVTGVGEDGGSGVPGFKVGDGSGVAGLNLLLVLPVATPESPQPVGARFVGFDFFIAFASEKTDLILSGSVQ